MTLIAGRLGTCRMLPVAQRATHIAKVRVVRIHFYDRTAGVTVRVVVHIGNDFSLVLTVTLDASILRSQFGGFIGTVANGTFDIFVFERHLPGLSDTNADESTTQNRQT